MSTHPNAFITGTDTGVGKTYTTCLLLRALREEGLRTAGFKPICCGDRDDVIDLQAAGDPELSVDTLNPVWLRTPAAPYAACMIENRAINIEHITRAYRQLADAHDTVLVEGAGGWEVPISRDYAMSDLGGRSRLTSDHRRKQSPGSIEPHSADGKGDCKARASVRRAHPKSRRNRTSQCHYH